MTLSGRGVDGTCKRMLAIIPHNSELERHISDSAECNV